MTDIAKNLQKQDPGSSLVVLYELEYASNSKAYFFGGLTESGSVTTGKHTTSVQFRETGGTVRTYTAIPINAKGFEMNSDGAMSRPEITIGNIGNVLSSAIGNTPLEDLVGKRLTKRTTLRKYLRDGAGDATPPIEYPKVVYIVDRLKSRNVLSVTFELAAPFDVAGITLPKRQVIAGACPFKYKAAALSVAKQDRIGGCNWDANFVATSNALFMNRFDEYILPVGNTYTTFSSNATAGNYYKTAVTLTKINADGTTASHGSDYNYWQCLSNTNTTPADNNAAWRRIRVYYTYSGSNTYNGYTDNRYNHFILESGVLWQVKKKTQVGSAHGARQEGESWTLGDVCGKKIASCRLRFQAKEQTGVSGGVGLTTARFRHLPFGGFPSVQQRR